MGTGTADRGALRESETVCGQDGRQTGGARGQEAVDFVMTGIIEAGHKKEKQPRISGGKGAWRENVNVQAGSSTLNWQNSIMSVK